MHMKLTDKYSDRHIIDIHLHRKIHRQKRPPFTLTLCAGISGIIRDGLVSKERHNERATNWEQFQKSDRILPA